MLSFRQDWHKNYDLTMTAHRQTLQCHFTRFSAQKNLFPESHDTAPYTFRHISYYNFSKDLITDCFLIFLHFVNHSILKSVIYQLLFDVA